MAHPHPGIIGPCYVIRYDAEEGFDSEERTIRITSLRERPAPKGGPWAVHRPPQVQQRLRPFGGCALSCLSCRLSAPNPRPFTSATLPGPADDLIDLEDGDALHWRREGERWEPPVEETYR
jgi:hypothetical protein